MCVSFLLAGKSFYFAKQILSVHMWKNYLQKSQVCSLLRMEIGRRTRRARIRRRCWTFLNDACKLYADHITLATADGIACATPLLPLWIALHSDALPPFCIQKIERFIS